MAGEKVPLRCIDGPGYLHDADKDSGMTKHIDLTWPDGNGHPMRIVNPELVRYGRDQEIIKNGKAVIERTVTEFTVATARPATEAVRTATAAIDGRQRASSFSTRSWSALK